MREAQRIAAPVCAPRDCSKRTPLADQAEEALDKLRAYGWLPDSDVLHASHYRLATNALVVTYANAYGRFSVVDNLCGFSFANTDPRSGAVIPQDELAQNNCFGTGSGMPPTDGVSIVYNDAVDGATLDLLARSPSSGTADFALDGAICHRNLFEGRDIVTGQRLTGTMRAASIQIRDGMWAVQLTGRLKNTPAVLVEGRSDTLIPANHAARTYFGVNQFTEPGSSDLHYVEVTHAQHCDALLAAGLASGYDTRYVPLHVYLIRALDWMYEHLTTGKPLPPSQVVRTIPRGGEPGNAPPLAERNVPPIAILPAEADTIYFSHGALLIPD
jgi:hydroxybutyrate-dimer hydrolase